MTDTETQSILHGPRGRAIDPALAIEQIGLMTRMRIGWHNPMYDVDYVKGQVSCGGRRKFWLIVKLERNDTYSIEFGKLVRKSFDWHVAAQVEGVYADQLSETIERVYQEVYS
jgi:hypothetical protein